MKICAYESLSLNEFKPFIAKCDFTPFMEYGVNPDLIAKYIMEELSNIVSRGGFVFVAMEQGVVIGLISSERLEWDSTHFGFTVSRISHLLASGDYFESLNVKKRLVSHLLTKCYSTLSLHLSARVYKEDLSSIHALESESFRLMDVLVTYSFNLQKQKRMDIDHRARAYHIRKIKVDEFPALSEISMDCFGNMPIATDRFHADPTFSKEKSDELYLKWLANSCQDPSSEVLVAERDGIPIGFNLCTTNKSLDDKIGINLGTIALTAVKSSERNKSVASSLLNASLVWFTDKADIVETGGQVSNYAMQRAWSKVGFRITRSQCTLHWSVLPDNP